MVQAGAYILKSGNLGRYLDTYRKHRVKLLRDHGRQAADNYRLGAYTTWEISFEKLSPKAVSFYAFLPLCTTRISLRKSFGELLLRNSKWPQDLEEIFMQFLDEEEAWDLMCFLDVTDELLSYSLMDFERCSPSTSLCMPRIATQPAMWRRCVPSRERYLRCQ